VKTIEELRVAYGWTHFDLAVRTGVRPGAIRDWESGKGKPRTIHLVRLAEVFGVKKDFITLDIVQSNTRELQESD
jgi:transcriptional regulator with XRE-family HTH domain